MTARFLLDTHPLLWALGGERQLPPWLHEALGDRPEQFAVSDATFWEIAIKRSTGKLDVPSDLPEVVTGLGFVAAPIARRHAWAVTDLPWHHRDPFDRLLVAQARDLGHALVSADDALRAYDVELLWDAAPA